MRRKSALKSAITRLIPTLIRVLQNESASNNATDLKFMLRGCLFVFALLEAVINGLTRNTALATLSMFPIVKFSSATTSLTNLWVGPVSVRAILAASTMIREASET